MKKRTSIKDHLQEIALTKRRSMIGLFVICTFLCLLIARLAYLQIVKHPLYVTLALENSVDLVPIEPSRGLIYDRNGVLLAENIPVFSLDVIPVQVTNLQKTLTYLSSIVPLTANELNQFYKQLKQHRRFEEIPLKLQLSESEVAHFVENQHHFPGILIKARLLRHYPQSEHFSHVLGYVGRINAQELETIDPVNYSASHYIGKLGIERYYEEELHGLVGYEQTENDASGKSVRTLKQIKGTPGNNIYLTIDSRLQLATENAFKGKRGAAVIIQPQTGQVLAMVSMPSYDPNVFVTGISQKDYQTLQNAEDKPLFNRAIRGLYPLASTVKPYLSLKGLNENFITPDYHLYDPGWFKLPTSSHIYHDWQRYGHGNVDMNVAITASCDIYFFELGKRMGIRRIDDILTEFGFGAPTGIDLDDELPGIVASPAWKQRVKHAHWYEGDTIISSIGQGSMQATPLQLAVAVATLANRGQHFAPYLLLGEQIPGQAYHPQPPVPLDKIQLKNNAYWEQVIAGMQNVTLSPNGTAYRAFINNHAYTVAAKTGTAQVIAKHNHNGETENQDNLPEKFRDHNLFIAFAPVDHPTIALAIITENSHVAAIVARDILDSYFNVQRPSP
ncbi:MAG TPA: penicillin-binding protein 2 [Gammaproteobacteria bacterium]|jgi:penicillin-binding protein 2|nr:penicillin-binding protein 2 [Gammaproteobacteria bacterium]